MGNIDINSPAYSVKAYLYFAIIIMGILGLVLALVTGNIYREATIENHQDLLRDLVTRQANQQLTLLRVEASDLAFSLQSEAGFVNEVRTFSPNRIRLLLEQQYQRQFAEDGIIRLKGLAVYDKEHRLIATTRHQNSESLKGAVCENVVQQAAQSKGMHRFKVHHGFCAVDDKYFLAILAPMGGFKPYAYLYLETDPVPALSKLETQVGMPIRIHSDSKNVLYRSDNWSEASKNTAQLHTALSLGLAPKAPVIHLTSNYDTSALNQKLSKSRNLVLLFAILTTVIAIVVITLISQQTVISPLRTLAHKLRMIREDKDQLGQQVAITGNREISLLAQEFNSLSIELKETYEALENMAEEARMANRAKSAFLANMSHEMRTPLTSILGFSDLALNTKQSPEELTAALKMITTSGHHLLGIINEILDLSKIEAEKLEIEHVDVPVFKVIDEICTLMKLHATEKGLSFSVDYHYPIPEFIKSDPMRLKQILLNLISNAIKFTHQGHVTVTVRYEEDCSQLRFDIDDSGIGMDEEQMGRIFDAFSQADASTTRRYGGTGLGLSLSRKLAKMLDGGIQVSSQVDVGSVFTLTIGTGVTEKNSLLQASPNPPTLKNLQTEHKTEEQDTVQLPCRILLAEDNPVNQLLVKKMLEKFGASVDVVENGLKAVETALKNNFDLVLMDLQMPVMDGLEATILLRESGYIKPIIALTANAMREDRQQCEQAGFDEFISKPVDRLSLLNKLSKALP